MTRGFHQGKIVPLFLKCPLTCLISYFGLARAASHLSLQLNEWRIQKIYNLFLRHTKTPYSLLVPASYNDIRIAENSLMRNSPHPERKSVHVKNQTKKIMNNGKNPTTSVQKLLSRALFTLGPGLGPVAQILKG